MESERAAYGFGANEDEHGNAWILLEPSGGQLSALKNKIITLQLREGISSTEAEQLAQTLNEMVEAIACTDVTKR